MTRWAALIALTEHAAATTTCSRGHDRTAGHRAVHDQELASVRDHLRSIGLDVTSRTELLAAAAGAESVVAWTRAMTVAGNASPIVLAAVNHVAADMLANLHELLRTAQHHTEDQP